MTRNKYGARRTKLDGIWFDSQAEARRYGELVLLQRAGTIQGLRVHPEYDLDVAGATIGKAVFDFEYHERLDPTVSAPDGRWCKVVVDVKGVDPPLSRWKRKHFEAQYGIHVQISPVSTWRMPLLRRRKASKLPTTLGSHLRHGGSL